MVLGVYWQYQSKNQRETEEKTKLLLGREKIWTYERNWKSEHEENIHIKICKNKKFL